MNHVRSRAVHTLRTALLLAITGAVLAGLIRPATAAEPPRSPASSSAQVAAVATPSLAAADCYDDTVVKASTINSAWGVTNAATAAAAYATGDQDPSENRVQYIPESASIQAIGTGACSVAVAAAVRTALAETPEHTSSTQAISAWWAGLAGITAGLTVRIGVLSAMLASGVGVTVARPVSEAAGGFVAGALTSLLTTGSLSRTFASGLYGAMAGVAGGALSRQVVAAWTRVPARLATVVDTMDLVESGVDAGNTMRTALNAVEAEWDAIINQFLATHP